jgi:hypothetical protein
MSHEDDGYFWPRWLAEDMKGLAVYSLGYPVAKASWGSGWPIAEAAVAALERVMSNRALRTSGDTLFVCHRAGSSSRSSSSPPIEIVGQKQLALVVPQQED